MNGKNGKDSMLPLNMRAGQLENRHFEVCFAGKVKQWTAFNN